MKIIDSNYCAPPYNKGRFVHMREVRGRLEVLKSEIMDGVQTETRKSSESSPLLSKTASSEYDNVSLKSRPETFDDALESTGVGLFHCILVLVAGWALASDSVEVQCISFVTPLLDNVDRNPDTKLAPSKVKKRVIMYTIFLTP